MKNEIGTYIQAFMDAHNIPRKLVSSGTGIHISTLSRILTGKQEIQFRHVFRIGFFLGCEVTKRMPEPGGARLVAA